MPFSLVYFFFFKQKTAYDMRISDWSSDVCSSDLDEVGVDPQVEDFLEGKEPVRIPAAERGDERRARRAGRARRGDEAVRREMDDAIVGKVGAVLDRRVGKGDRKSTRLNSSH